MEMTISTEFDIMMSTVSPFLNPKFLSTAAVTFTFFLNCL